MTTSATPITLRDRLRYALDQLALHLRPRLEYYTAWLRPPVGYRFELNATEEQLARFRYVYGAHLAANPHRYVRRPLERQPEANFLLDTMPSTELCQFALYLIAALSREAARPDVQYYHVVSDLLRQVLAREPWADDADLESLLAAVYFLSPAGYEGVLYWPLTTLLRAALTSRNGRTVTPGLRNVLTMIDDELRQFFGFGYGTEVQRCQALLYGLLYPVGEGESGETVNALDLTLEAEYSLAVA